MAAGRRGRRLGRTVAAAGLSCMVALRLWHMRREQERGRYRRGSSSSRWWWWRRTLRPRPRWRQLRPGRRWRALERKPSRARSSSSSSCSATVQEPAATRLLLLRRSHLPPPAVRGRYLWRRRAGRLGRERAVMSETAGSI